MMPNGRNIAPIFPKSRIDGEHRHKLAALMRSLFSEKSPGSKTGACAFAKDTEFDRYILFLFLFALVCWRKNRESVAHLGIR